MVTKQNGTWLGFLSGSIFRTFHSESEIWSFKASTSIHQNQSFQGLFQAWGPVTCRVRKAILETMIRLPWKAALLTCFRYKEMQNNCQVSKLETCSYWRCKARDLSSKPWSSQLWTQFKQLRIEAWKSQDFNFKTFHISLQRDLCCPKSFGTIEKWAPGLKALPLPL